MGLDKPVEKMENTNMSFRRIALIITALAAMLILSVSVAGAQADASAGRWTGAINSADGGVLVVSGVRFQASNLQVDPSVTLTPGTVVEVKFNAANGGLTAVEVEAPGTRSELPGSGRVTGVIQQATADTVSIGGVPFNVVGARIDDDASLNAGSLVELRFTFNGTALTVSRIEAEDTEDDAKAIGVIDTVDGSTATVAGVPFDLTSAQVDDGVLVAGSRAEIEFTVEQDGRVRALEVSRRDDRLDDLNDDGSTGDDNRDDFDVSGTVEALGDGTITVNGQVYNISQAVIDDEGTLAPGINVEIDFVTTSDGRNVALEVEIEDDDNDDDRNADFILSGRIDAINGSSLTVNGITVDITGTDDDDDLEVGELVTVYFRRDASGALVVASVDDIDDIDDPFDDDRDDDDDNDDSDDNNGNDDDNSDDDDDVVIDGCVRPDGWNNYRVRRGDTLSRIAGAANTTIDALVDANCLTSASFIVVGQRLFVPVRINPPGNDDRDDDGNDDDDDDDDDRGGDDDDDDNGGDDNGGDDDDGDDDNGDDDDGDDDDGDDDDGDDDDGDDDDGDDDDGDDD
jgi:hypothetical protein